MTDNTPEVSQTIKWILTGAAVTDVAEAIKTTYPTADPAKLIFAAMDRFRDAGAFDPAVVRGFLFSATMDVYRRATESNDHASALRALKQLSEMVKHVSIDDPAESTAEIALDEGAPGGERGAQETDDGCVARDRHSEAAGES